MAGGQPEITEMLRFIKIFRLSDHAVINIAGRQITADPEHDNKTYRKERYDLFSDISDCVLNLSFLH
jgi:hypothetical protein